MNRIILDVETTGNPAKVSTLHVYDLGFKVVDNDMNTLEEHSIVISDVFYGMQHEMQSAYYANKLPQYHEQIKNGTREVLTFLDAKRLFAHVCQEYKVKQVWAYNAAFDKKALNNTTQSLSNGFCSFFTPYKVKWCDIAPCAAELICNQKKYFKFAAANGFVSDKGNVKTTAEGVYSYLIGSPFIEAHTGLEDVQIESEILAACLRKKKKMNKEPRPAWQIPQKKFKEWAATQ